jgi:hypothetical protein
MEIATLTVWPTATTAFVNAMALGPMIDVPK